MENISFFPSPIPGETVYSWISRFHHLSGHRSFKCHTLKLLGLRSGRPSNEFPSFLPALSDASGVEISSIIHRMTSVHYYQPFLPSGDFQSLLISLKTGNTKTIQTVISSVANRITPGKLLYSCNQCIKDDMEMYGFPIWHVEHQLPGVLACPWHSHQLNTINRTNIHALFPNTESTKPSLAIANQLSKLIADEFSSKLATLNRKNMFRTYLVRLKEMELLSHLGNLRLLSLKELIKKPITPLFDLDASYHWFFNALNTDRYPECLFYKKNSNLHPLKHLVFIEALFGTWEMFIKAYEHAPEYPQDFLRTPKIKTQKETGDLSTTAIKRLLQGESLRSVSKTEGISISTLKVRAAQHQIPINTRPSKIFKKEERDIWRQLFIGKKAQDMASKFRVSKGTVEQILRKHPELIPLRKKIWFYQKRCHCRHALSQYIKEHVEDSRTEIKQSNYAVFMWLYMNDRKWLETNLPNTTSA
ncbi:MAG: TniQ family protein [Neptuniibacter sp.]